jgi:hypothetical protein
MNRYEDFAQSSVSNVLVDGVDDQQTMTCAAITTNMAMSSRQIAHAQGHLVASFRCLAVRPPLVACVGV